MSVKATLHANCVLVDEAGILIRGVSGAGKSAFSRALILAARNQGLFARLVSDDRTRVVCRNSRLLAYPVKEIRGLMEVRGIGIVPVPVENAAVIRLVIDLVDAGARMPGADEMAIDILSVKMPRLIQIKGENIVDLVLGYICGSDFPT